MTGLYWPGDDRAGEHVDQESFVRAPDANTAFRIALEVLADEPTEEEAPDS